MLTNFTILSVYYVSFSDWQQKAINKLLNRNHEEKVFLKEFEVKLLKL